MEFIWCTFLVVLCTYWCQVKGVPSSTRQPAVPESLIRGLFLRVGAEQVKKDAPFIPFIQLYKKKGIYGSEVKLNFRGNLQLADFRRLAGVFDNNIFATAWVTSSLLEANRYGIAPIVGTEQVKMSIDAMSEYHDHNVKYNTSTMTFWHQQYNKTLDYYQCTPANLLDLFKLLDGLPLDKLEEFLDKLGLKDLAGILKTIMISQNGYKSAFHIPPDFDDTFVNLGLGSLLYGIRDQYPTVWEAWSSHNTNLSSVFDALKKYAYRPFSTDPNTNSIDPRTYFWIRSFLDQAKAQGRDVALVPTWVQNLDEARVTYTKGVVMPLQVNNVDTTVAANTVYGLTSAVLSGLVSPKYLDDPDIAQIYHNTTSMIVHELNTNMSNRPDLALTYYPSQIEFDWFVSRTYALMDAERKTKPLPRQVMEDVYQLLKGAVEGKMTQYIVSKAKVDNKGGIYYDDFLGDGDIGPDNKTLIRAEDRIFTTAMAVNALLYTWTEHNAITGNSTWKSGVPSQVRSTVSGCVTWLVKHALGLTYRPWNAFFSGSAKGNPTLPFWYPANRFEYLSNGTEVPGKNHYPMVPTVYAMRGYMSPDQYQAALKERHFGRETPLEFHGYNEGPGFFPLWSSSAYTYATSLLALARYRNTAD